MAEPMGQPPPPTLDIRVTSTGGVPVVAVLRPIELTTIGSLLSAFPVVDDALAWVSSTQGVRQTD
ncbi:hypothetical protein [Saccharothrix sp. HUAS TT1]|uniref:hypothetical protein n=1 Tax=unclassified Saccharothrix TaxID=2593673 RepID=UPI00345BB0CD